MARIAVLSEQLINKIAAGEVVERPASVVKELCENSLDASARSIRVALREGGLLSIQVTDDGHGMGRADAQVSLLRHATSKLRDLEGLFSIVSMGFRGEALPAIASVSRFRLTTCEPDAEFGTAIGAEGGEDVRVDDAPPVPGTSIVVEDLFFNTPARRKFLKRTQTELGHCQDAVIRLALANPEVAFSLEHDGNVLLSSAPCPGDLRERIAEALGVEVHPHLLAVDERRLGFRVHGFVASPEFTMPNARGILSFVNRRYVRDRGINHAVQRAFQGTLPGGRQPVAVLFLELDPHAVDVNVHPQKLEVRFADAREVHEGVFAGIARALRGAPWLGKSESGEGTEPVTGAHYALAVERFLTRAQESGGGAPLAPLFPNGVAEPSSGFGLQRPGIHQRFPPGYFSRLRTLGMLGKRFAVCEGTGGSLVVVDPHAAMERVLVGIFRRALEAGGLGHSQQPLFSRTVDLAPAVLEKVVKYREVLLRLGVDAEPFGGTSMAVKALPPSLEEVDARVLLEELMEVMPALEETSVGALAAAVRILACHAGRSVRRDMSHDELMALFRNLDEADFELPCVHPQVVLHEVPYLDLARHSG